MPWYLFEPTKKPPYSLPDESVGGFLFGLWLVSGALQVLALVAGVVSIFFGPGWFTASAFGLSFAAFIVFRALEPKGSAVKP